MKSSIEPPKKHSLVHHHRIPTVIESEGSIESSKQSEKEIIQANKKTAPSKKFL